MSKRELAKGMMEHWANELHKMSRYPETESYPDGTVIHFTMTYKTGHGDEEATYDYAAIKSAGKWYTTGKNSPQKVTWTELTEWMSTRAGAVYLMKDDDKIIEGLEGSEAE